MNFILVEALTFGLERLVKAAEEFNVTLHLLTRDKNVYFYELKNINSKHLVLIEIDTFNKDEIINYCKNVDNFSGIINLTDTWTNIVGEISTLLGCQSQNVTSTDICRDKAKLRKILQDKNLTKGKLNLIDLNKWDEKIDTTYPVIIKDISGTGSKNVWIAEDYRNLIRTINFIKENTNLNKILVETYFKGTLYSAETISFNGKTKLIAISSRILSDLPYFMEKAISLPLDINNIEFNGIEKWITKILSTISYTDGYAHTEFIITDDGFEVVEINPRLGGVLIGEALCQAYDYNVYKAFIEIAMKKEPELFNIDLKNKCYTGQVFIYANEEGEFYSIEDDYINKNKTKIYPCALPGKKISNITDQSACVAILFTKGTSSEIALLNALSEANKVKVIMSK